MTVQTYLATAVASPVRPSVRRALDTYQIEPDEEILLGVGKQPLQEAYAAVDRPEAPPWVFGSSEAWAVVYTPAR